MPKKLSHEDFVKIIKEKYNDLFEVIGIYNNSREKILIKCKENHEFFADPKKFTKTKSYIGCPICQKKTKEDYLNNPKYCKQCGKIIEFTNTYGETMIKDFCNKSCSAIYNNTHLIKKNRRVLKYCINCGKELNNRKSKYCNGKCQSEFQYKSYIDRWKNGLEDGIKSVYYLSNYIRKYIHEKYNHQCALCGWNEINNFTNKIPLEVEHIDGNHMNNKEENLILLCPNCHSLTSTYKGANKGNGRKNRKKYYLK